MASDALIPSAADSASSSRRPPDRKDGDHPDTILNQKPLNQSNDEK